MWIFVCMFYWSSTQLLIIGFQVDNILISANKITQRERWIEFRPPPRGVVGINVDISHAGRGWVHF